MSNEAKRDLSLFPGQYAYIQDGSKGVVKVCVGPLNVTLAGQDRPVKFDTTKRTFVPAEKLDDAVCITPIAVQGYYIELLNPAKNSAHPPEGRLSDGTDLDVGRKINLQGPVQFALWPGQVASVIRGHHLRSNQYLLCRVYDEKEARENWGKAVLKAQSKLTPPPEGASEEEQKKYQVALAEEAKRPTQAAIPPPDLTIGKMFIIKGTDVSFFIPPTGITVIPEKEENGKEFFARDALTLEQLEYAVLVDENGKKRYPKGPAVVFPAPTERFMEQKNDKGQMTRKFQAIEMNPLQGIHLKVLVDFEDEFTDKEGKKQTVKRKAGEELFLKGDEYPIFFPREELAAIKYDGKTKHFATMITKGEGRYVADRLKGNIRMALGEDMLLPDPRKEIIVQRVLSDEECELLYPGNAEVLEINRRLRPLLDKAPTTRQGTISQGELERSMQKGGRMKGVPGSTEFAAVAAAGGLPEANYLAQSFASNALAMDASQVSREQNYTGDQLERASTYTKPRSLNLSESKYQGVVTVQLWNGFAALVVSKSGGRRVEVGPKPILLAYDEMLEKLYFSSGKPKSTDRLIKSGYLQIENFVTDIIEVETSDHVKIELKVSYRVNFVGDTDEERMKWFSVQNYVKYLCDHAKSVVKAAARKLPVAQFYENSTEIIRDIILGKAGADGKRPGMFFEDNNLRVRDVEVLGAPIKDESIRALLDKTQHDVVKTNIELAASKRRLEVTKENERINQETSRIQAETTKTRNEIQKELLASELTLTLLKLGNELQKVEEERKVEQERSGLAEMQVTAELHREKLASDQTLALKAAEQAQRIELLKAEAEATVTKFKAVEGNFTNALMALSNNEVFVKAAEAWSFQKMVGGESISDALRNVFKDSNLAPLINKIAGNGTPVEVKNSGSQQQPRV
jgi:major vault protein